MDQLIEAKTGFEQHTSSWGKFFLHGIEIVADERIRDGHHAYTVGAAEAKDGAIFTVWAARGDKHGTNENDYYILLANSAQPAAEIENGYGYVRGRWEVLAHGDGKVRAPRLLAWTKGQELTERLARHLGAQIHLRGKAQPDPLD